MGHRTFGSTTPKDLEEVTFDLQGTYVVDQLGKGGTVLHAKGDPWEEKGFTCVPVAPAGSLDDFAGMAAYDGAGNRTWKSGPLLGFLRQIVIDADIPRLDAVTHDKYRGLDLNELGELVMWLAEELVGRPTPPPSS